MFPLNVVAGAGGDYFFTLTAGGTTFVGYNENTSGSIDPDADIFNGRSDSWNMTLCGVSASDGFNLQTDEPGTTDSDSVWKSLSMTGTWSSGTKTVIYTRSAADNYTDGGTVFTWRYDLVPDDFIAGNVYECRFHR